MKLLFGVLCLVSTAASLPTSFFPHVANRQSGFCATSGQASAAVNDIILNVVQVNSFVDQFSPTEPAASLQNAASTAFFFENAAGTQLTILSDVCNTKDTAFFDGISAIRLVEGQLLAAMTNIQDGVGVVQDNMNDINKARCCTILPNLDDVFSAAADAVGVTRAITPKPKACTNVSC
jgi:hypothetical protein